MAFMPHLLLAHGSPDQRTRLGGILEKGGYQVASSGLEDGLDDAGLDGFDALLASPEAVKRHDLLHRRGSRPLIVLAEGGDVRQAVEAIKQGVADYLVLPIDAGELLGAVGNALAALTTQGEDQRRPPFAIIGSSGAMAEVREHIAEVAPTDSAVLIEGESGTGKDFLAHAIHAASLRRSAPFITVNCAAIPDAMIETELFGQPFSEPSAPAGGRAGLVDAASGGTLYLDEVGRTAHRRSGSAAGLAGPTFTGRPGHRLLTPADHRHLASERAATRGARLLPRSPVAAAERFPPAATRAARTGSVTPSNWPTICWAAFAASSASRCCGYRKTPSVPSTPTTGRATCGS